MRLGRSHAVLALCAAVAACGGDSVDPNSGGTPGTPTPTPTPTPSAICSSPVDVSLAPGQEVIVDPGNNSGCVRFPAASIGGAEYLYAALATNGLESPSGISTSYDLRGTLSASGVSSGTTRPLSRIDPTLNAFAGRLPDNVFHTMLRNRERILAAAPGGASFSAALSASIVSVPPIVGQKRTFKVCQSTNCTAFTDVTATARYVGPKGAIYLDDTVPAGGYTQTDLNAVGNLFDDYLYPIDTAAFGRESDLDNNGVVVVLLSDQVNALSGNCNADGSVILGYFFGNDLIPSNQGSNGGEVFYSLVPDPNNSQCTISHDFASQFLAPTFIHEFQHMISFNQHVLVNSGLSEDTWLNEGLSHYAEELGGKSIPDQFCDGDCLTQFALGDIYNSYSYLLDPESYFLVEPGSSNGLLEERGANWLFVRWTVDHFGGANPNLFTRSLVNTSRVGSANIEARTGQALSRLIPEWQLANYVDDLPSFTAQNTRLRYLSWNFRSVYASLNAQSPGSFPRPYPLVPDSTQTGVYQRAGTLRAGSGRHLRIVQASQAGSVTLQLTDGQRRSLAGNVAAPRIGIVRIR